MSAFVLGKEHIDAMAALAVFGPLRTAGQGVSPDSSWSFYWWDCVPRGLPISEWQQHRHDGHHTPPDDIGRMLLAENIASVAYRYPDCAETGEYPGPTDRVYQTAYHWAYPRIMPTAVEGLSMIACYEYQACEHPGWDDSEAHAFCDALRHALISRLPGYAEAPWEWSERTIARPA
jgi:hypothetical protein